MDDKELSSSILQFSSRILQKLDSGHSTVSSPLSAEFVLAILTLATTGPGHDELLATLGIANSDVVRSSFSNLIKKLDSIQGITLSVANKVYVMSGVELDPELKENAINDFRTEMELINFLDARAAANSINKWAESKTNNKIKNVITEGSLNADTQVVLINAIYFNGAWKYQFSPRSTYNGTFYVSETKAITVPMMVNTESGYKTGACDIGKILVIPYKEDQSHLVIILPNKIDGLDEVIDQLANGYDLLSKFDSLRGGKTRVTIPKFKIETEINLKKVLSELGVKSIFSGGVDKMITDKTPLRVSEAVQKAFIDVNEVGTEAAAVTSMRLMKRSLPVEFKVDRPFLYLLTAGNTVLFVGVYRGDGSTPRDATPYEDNSDVYFRDEL